MHSTITVQHSAHPIQNLCVCNTQIPNYSAQYSKCQRPVRTTAFEKASLPWEQHRNRRSKANPLFLFNWSKELYHAACMGERFDHTHIAAHHDHGTKNKNVTDRNAKSK